MNDQQTDLFAGSTPGQTPHRSELRVATLTEPYATLMRLRAKRLETRSGTFPRNYRGDCAIQAAKTWPKGYRALCAVEPFYTVLFSRLLRELGLETDDPRLKPQRIAEFLEPTLGHIIALGDIVASFWTDGLLSQNAEARANLPFARAEARCFPDQVEEVFGNYDTGRLALQFRRVRGLSAPIPVKGMLGLWRPSDELATQIRRTALDFHAESLKAQRRVSGDSVCELCHRRAIDHPYDPEIVSDQERPFLVRGCNGDLLKL